MPFAVLIFNVTSSILNFLLGNLYFYQKLLPLSAGFCNNNTDLSFKTNIKSRLPHVHGQRISELTYYCKSGNFGHDFILAPKYEVPKLNTPKYVTLQKLTAKI